jgi:hypothetical protein
MNSISRRIRKLEERLGPPGETAFTRRLRERLVAGLRRVAEARARGELGPPETGPLFEARRRRLLEAIANTGMRRRNRFRH